MVVPAGAKGSRNVPAPFLTTEIVTLEHLEMLGPLICHTIRPLVFRAGLWTIELEKSWNHLFEMVATLMKRGYPPNSSSNSLAMNGGIFPSLTHTLILKDTWAVIVQQMHTLGLATFTKLSLLDPTLATGSAACSQAFATALLPIPTA